MTCGSELRRRALAGAMAGSLSGAFMVVAPRGRGSADSKGARLSARARLLHRSTARPAAGENRPAPILPIRVAEPTEVFIQGLTRDGKTFRPSDWAERLAGAMSCVPPGRRRGGGPAAFIGYSPYCVPRDRSTASRA